MSATRDFSRWARQVGSLSAFAEQAGIARQNARLFQQEQGPGIGGARRARILMTSAEYHPELEIQARRLGILYDAHKRGSRRRLRAVVAKVIPLSGSR